MLYKNHFCYKNRRARKERKMLVLLQQHNMCTILPHMRIEPRHWTSSSCERVLCWCCDAPVKKTFPQIEFILANWQICWRTYLFLFGNLFSWLAFGSSRSLRQCGTLSSTNGHEPSGTPSHRHHSRSQCVSWATPTPTPTPSTLYTLCPFLRGGWRHFPCQRSPVSSLRPRSAAPDFSFLCGLRTSFWT